MTYLYNFYFIHVNGFKSFDINEKEKLPQKRFSEIARIVERKINRLFPEYAPKETVVKNLLMNI